MNSGNLFENPTGSQSRKIYLMEIPTLDIEDKPVIEDENSTLLITTDQLANAASNEENNGIGNLSTNFINAIVLQSFNIGINAHDILTSISSSIILNL